jgi:hypothetical protein
MRELGIGTPNPLFPKLFHKLKNKMLEFQNTAASQIICKIHE